MDSLSEMKPFDIGPGEGTVVEGPAGGPLSFKVRSSETDGALTVFENRVPPGPGTPLHVHHNEDEAWYILEGEFRFRLGDEISTRSAGSFVFIPRTTAHCWQNVGEEPARVLVIFTPSGIERFFDEFAKLPAGPPDLETLNKIGQRFAMDVLGPPLGVSHPL